MMNTKFTVAARPSKFPHQPARGRKLRHLAALVALSCGMSAGAQANDTTWNIAGSGVWNNAANWTAGIPANVNTTIVRFGGTTSYTATQDITSATLVNQFVFTNTGVGQTVTISGGAIANRGVQLAGTTPVFTFGGTANLSFDANANIRFNADATLSGNGTGTLTIAALGASGAGSRSFTINLSNLATPVNITSLGINNNATGNWTLTLATTSNATVGTITNGGTPTGSFIKANLGNLTITGAGTYTGSTTLQNGTTFISDFNAFGTATTPIQLGNPSSTNANIANIAYSGVSASYTRGFNLGWAGGRLDVTNAATNLTIDSVISGAGPTTSELTKLGPGTLTLNAANTYGGPTTISAGTLALGAAGSFNGSNVFTITSGALLNVASSSLTISSGSLTAGRTAGFAADLVGNATLNSSTISIAGNTAYGTLTQTGNLAIDSGTLQFNLNNVNTVGAGVNDLIDITGNLALSGTIAVNVTPLNSTIASGSYRLFNYTGSLTGGAANFAQPVVAAPGRNTYTYDTSTPGQVNLNVATAPSGNLTWVGGVNSNSWDLQNTINWTGEADSKFYTGDTVNFTDAGLTNNTVNLNGAVQPFAVNVSNTTGNYIFSSTTSGSLAGIAATLTKTGAGTLTIQTANTFDGAVNVNEGILIAANPAALGSSVGSTNVASGAQVQFTGGGSFAEPFSINGTGIASAGALQNTSGATTIAGTVTLVSAASITNNDLTNTLVFDVATGNAFTGTGTIPLTIFGAGNIDINDPISTGVTGGVTKNGTGTLTLNGTTGNGTTGGYIINGGLVLLNKTDGVDATRGNVTIGNGTDPATVRLLAANQIRDTDGTDVVTVNANATLDLNGFSETVTSLFGIGTVTSTAGTFTADTGNFAGLMTGAMSFTKGNDGTFTISNTANTFTGTLRVNNGILEVLSLADSGPGSNGLSTIQMVNTTNAAATLRYLGSGATLNRQISITANGNAVGNAILESSGTGPLVLNSDISRLNTGSGQKTFVMSGTNTGANLIAGNIINGAATLNVAKDGVGTWRLTGTNIYTGTTTVTAGKLIIDGNNSGAIGAVSVASGATLAGTGTIGGLTSLSSAGILAPGNSTGNLTFAAGVNLSSGGVLQWELGALSTDGTTPGQFFDMLTVSGGNLSLDGTSALTLDFGLIPTTGPNSADAFWTSAKSWKIIDVTGAGTNTVNSNLSTITNATYTNGYFTTTVGSGADAGDIFLNYTLGVAGPPIWQGANNDNWTAAASWTGSVPNSATAEAKFVTTGGTTANLDANQTVNKLTFDATAAHTISGANKLTLAGTTPSISTAATNTATQTVAVNVELGAGTTINVQGGTLELNVPTTNPTIGTGVTATVATGATLSLGGAGNALSNGTTHVNVTNNGTLTATTNAQRVGNIDGTGMTIVTSTGASLIASHIRQTTLNVGAGNTVTVAANGTNTGTSKVTTLNMNATGKLDLQDNDLIVDNGNLATLTAKLASGLDISGSYGNGPGITSSAFASNPNFNTVLGVAPNSDLAYSTFSGQTVDANDVLIKYTYFGDADLNGLVDAATDFDLYITGLTSGGSFGGWLYGDFDYNGTVDAATDFDLYITGLTSQGAPLLTAGGGLPITAIPEPSTLVFGALGGIGLAAHGLRRRRLAQQAA